MSAGPSQSDITSSLSQANDESVSLGHGPDHNAPHDDLEREARLADVIERTIIPNLLQQNKVLIGSEALVLHPDQSNVEKLTAFITGPDNSDALEYIYSLRNLGISLDDLYLELLEPTARYLGELWNQDEIDFFAVTMGINRLQRIVHHFADLDKVESYDEKRRALIVVAPGDDHSFGNQLVQKFMKAAGWSVEREIGSDPRNIINLVSQEWIAIIGFSIGGMAHIHSLRALIKEIRAKSFNPHIGIMIGGSIVSDRPELVEEIGADGTANSAASAVILAKTLLAKGLQAKMEADTKSDLP